MALAEARVALAPVGLLGAFADGRGAERGERLVRDEAIAQQVAGPQQQHAAVVQAQRDLAQVVRLWRDQIAGKTEAPCIIEAERAGLHLSAAKRACTVPKRAKSGR